MSVQTPVTAIVFGNVTPPQGDVVELKVHLGCTEEVSSFDVCLQNWNAKYSPGGTSPISVGMDGSISVGRGANCPLLITCRVESVKYESSSVESYVHVSGRCWGERLFRRVVTKTYENKKGEEIVKDLLDYYVGLSHVRDSAELVEDTDTTYTRLEYENTPVIDILRHIAESADNAGVIGYDFRVAPDAKFEFFPRNSKDSSLNLNERIEQSEYSMDIHRVRNKAVIYGAEDKSTPSDKDAYSDGYDNYLLSNDAEVAHSDSDYQLVAECIYNPGANEKIHLKTVEMEAKVSFGTGYYIISVQKEGAGESAVAYDIAFTNTSYQLKQHSVDIWGDLGKDVTIRYYTKMPGGGHQVFSKNHRAQGDDFHGDWSEVAGDLSLDSSKKALGIVSVKCYAVAQYYGSCALDFGEDINCELFPLLNFWLNRESTFNGSVQITLFDEATKSANHIVTLGPDQWFQQQLRLGSKNADSWITENGFDWTQVRKVRITCHFTGTGTGSFWVDGVFFGGRRYSAAEEDANSQNNYGLRELVEVDEELWSDDECSSRAKASLASLKSPAERLSLRSTVIDFGSSPPLPGDTVHVALPNEGVDADFRVANVEYDVDAKTQTLETTFELGREAPLLADYIFALRSKTDHLSRYKAARRG